MKATLQLLCSPDRTDDKRQAYFAIHDSRSPWLANLSRPDAVTLLRRNPGWRIGPPLPMGGKTRKQLVAGGVVGLYAGDRS